MHAISRRSFTSRADKVPFPFGNGALSVDNMLRLARSPLMPAHLNQLTWVLGENRWEVSRASGQDPLESTRVGLLQGEHSYLFVASGRRPGLLGRLFRWRRPALSCFQGGTGKDNPSEPLDAAAPAWERDILPAWHQLLHAVAQGEFWWPKLCEAATPQRIEALLALPVIQDRLTTDGDMVQNGQWFDDSFYGYGRTAQGGARVMVARQESEHRLHNGEADLCHFYYGVLIDEQPGRLGTELSFLPRQTGPDGEPVTRTFALYHYPSLIASAYQHFLELEQRMAEANAAFVEEQEAAAQTKRQRLDSLQQQAPAPMTHCRVAGHDFRVIRAMEAAQILDALRFAPGETQVYSVQHDAWRFPFEGDAYFLLADQSVHVPALDLDVEVEGLTIGGIICLGDLTVDGHVIEHDSDWSPALAVLGDLTARHVSLGGSVFFVGGDLRCECLYGFYNHGKLYVNGCIEAAVVIAKDFEVYAGEIQARGLISSDSIHTCHTVEDEDGHTSQALFLMPTTCDAEDVLIDEVLADSHFWGVGFPDDHKLIQAMLAGRSVVDTAKLDRLFENFVPPLPGLFQAVFGDSTSDPRQTMVEAEFHGHVFAMAHVDWGSRSIGKQTMTHRYRLEVAQVQADGRFELVYSIFADEEGGDTRTMSMAPDDDSPCAQAVKYAFRLALARLQVPSPAVT